MKNASDVNAHFSNPNSIITASVHNGGKPGAGAMEAGMAILDLTLPLGGAGVETAAHIAGALGSDGASKASLLGGINDKLGDLGLLCSIAQVSYGMAKVGRQN